MQYRQSLLDVERSATVTVLIDFDALRLQAVDRDGNEIDQSFASLAELERTYRKRVAPLFADERCEDLDRGSPATPITSMTAFANELRECGYDWVEQPRVVGDAVEGFVAELMTKIRRELNRALGAEDATLEHVVLLVGDSLIKPAVKDPPAIAGLGEEEIELAALPGLEELALIETSPTAEPEELEPDEVLADEAPTAPEAEEGTEAPVEATFAGALTDALRSEVWPAWQPVLERWLADPSPTVLAAIAVTAAYRGLSLGPALVAAAERAGARAPLGPLLWAMGRLREPAALPLLSHHAGRLEGEEAPVATLALLRFGEPATLEHVVRLTSTHPWACSLLAIAGGPMHASIFQGRLARALVTADEIQAAALFGDAAVVPRLLECLARGLHPEATAQALYVLTGAPMIETVVEPAPAPERLPNGEPDPRDRIRSVQLVQDPTPWREWWSGHQAAFQPGRRHRLGQPASPVVLGHTLHRFVLPRPLRQLAAEEIGLRYRPRHDLDVDMRVRSQLAGLAELAALRQSDAVVSRTDGMWVLGRQLLR